MVRKGFVSRTGEMHYHVVMSESSANLPSFEGYHLALLSTVPRVPLNHLIEQRGGKLSEFSLFSPVERQVNQQLQRKSISQFANQILTGEIDFLVFVTGAGVTRFFQQASRQVDRQRLIDCISDTITIAGSALAAKALEEMGIEAAIVLESPKSWREILIAMDYQLQLANFNVGLEESDSIHELLAGIESRGGRVYPLSIFPCAMPQDISIAREFIQRIKEGQFHCIIFSDQSSVAEYLFLKKRLEREHGSVVTLKPMLVVSCDAETSELLGDRSIRADLTLSLGHLHESLQKIAELIKKSGDRK